MTTRRRSLAPSAPVTALALAAALAAAAAAQAQGLGQAQPQAQASPPPGPRSPALVRVGKWATLGLAAGFTALGAVTHDRADRSYQSLLDYCRTHGPCPIGADGRYGNAGAEAMYQRVLGDDRAARAWLAGGEIALVGSAVLFILELKTKREPENIPFSPYLATSRFGTLVGVRIGVMGRR